MHRMRRGCLIGGLLIWIAVDSRPSQAQYTANFQTNIISGVTSNWSGDYYVGNTNFADVLIIQSAGLLGDVAAFVGNTSASSNNSVLVTGSGSVWSNHASLFFGAAGPGNSLVISNGGRVIGSSPSEAFVVGDSSSSSNNNVLVTGIGSVWSNSGPVTIGLSGSGNSLVISNGGLVISGNQVSGSIGSNSGSSSNTVLITGSGSAWSNVMSFSFGGLNNSLTISEGGRLIAYSGLVGGSNNSLLVTGSGSLWSNSASVSIGYHGANNNLVISNGGVVVGVLFGGTVGYYTDSSNNSVLVGIGGLWQNSGLYVGYQGTSNLLEVAGGSVYATNLVIGFSSATCNNLLQLDSGTVAVTNSTQNAVLEVRDGQLILSGGVLQADTLVITNPCAQFVHTGGTLIVGNVVVDPNTFRIVSVARQSNDMLITWMMGPGATNTLQATAGDGSGGYSTNGFSDIFIVTNNTTVGTVTNYLDIGAATNTPSRYYRARLIP
ncbi:MAG: hypothetical protein ACLPT4_13065 [Verrucomicrobiia bacterium]